MLGYVNPTASRIYGWRAIPRDVEFETRSASHCEQSAASSPTHMPTYFIGVLSGTSMDAVDAALLSFDPAPIVVATHSVKYPADLQSELLALAVPGDNEIDRLGRADVLVGRLFARAVVELIARAGVPASQISAIGSHGQTIRHRPVGDAGFTLQIGDPNVIATETGLPVVADFRRKDMALGGQGAPLVPKFHQAVFGQPGSLRVVVNIGGIANLTVLDGTQSDSVIGFDSGPGNTLMDGWCRRTLGLPMDRDGALASQGRIIPTLLDAFFSDPYFSQRPPKSTGPEYFSAAWLDRHLTHAGGAPAAADVQATLLELTVRSISDAIIQASPGPEKSAVFVCGGGAHNTALMRSLQAHLPGSKVSRTESLGVAGEWVEAALFAWLAHQRLQVLPGNCPTVTGAKRPAVLGGLWLPG